jgi:hypothetical protein
MLCLLPFASVQRSLLMPLEACRKPKAKRPSRALPPATIRPESFVLLHEIARAESDAQAVPQRRYAACSAVLGSSLDCVWPDVARLLVPYTVLAGVLCFKGTVIRKRFSQTLVVVHLNTGALAISSGFSPATVLCYMLLVLLTDI